MKTVLDSRFKRIGAQHGVGLLEVLIALVIFALGVVGMAGLQLHTISLTMDSTQRSYVVAKSQDIADRIRSNGIAPALYLDTYKSSEDFCDGGEPLNCADVANTAACAANPGLVAAFDLHETFCVGEGSYDKQVVEWEVTIGCEFPDVGGMTGTANCDELGAEVFVETSWFARSLDGNTATDDPRRDAMTLRFVP